MAVEIDIDVDLILPKHLIVGSVEFINDWKRRLKIDLDCDVVLVDDSFIKWTIYHKKEPVPLIQALIGVAKVSLKTTKCTIERISSRFWKHPRNSRIADNMVCIPRVCNHPSHYLSAEACMREVLSLPKYNKYFFPTLRKEVYESAAVRNARFKPVITVIDGAMVINEVNLFRKHGVVVRQRVKDEKILQFVDDKPSKQLKFVRECFGLFGTAYVLCDASFLVWAVDEDIEPIVIKGARRTQGA
ncbi:hypothetical protein HanIR_Chr15g0731481 [Helianthus annuus]|nr:hypothetical protein HanIR_Chr15g0731481 [Helianthus annuus]